MTTLDEESGKCVLRGEDLSDAPYSTVHKKGLQRFAECSRICGDGLAERWISRESEVVHEKCLKRYRATRKVGDILKRKFSEEFTNDSGELLLFNFHDYCFICAERCSEEDEKRKSRDRRRNVYRVSGRTQLEDKVRAAAMKVDDIKGKQVLDRLKENINLAAERAIYHQNCLAACCMSMQHFKTMLEKQYGDNVLFSSRGRKKSIITFRNEADRILLNHYEAQLRNFRIKPSKKNQAHEVLVPIPCYCSTNCTNLTCTCRRSGSQCTFACKNCYHANCENAAPAYIDEDNDEVDVYDIPSRET